MYLLVDIGGTNTRVAVAKNLESFEKTETFPTPKNFEEGIGKVVEVAKRISQGSSIEGVILGIAGPLNNEKTMLINAPNLEGWIGVPLTSELERRFGCFVRLFNDADLVGLGEANFGAGRGCDIVAYLTISTGVGGSRIVDGEVDRYAFGFEPGHMLLDGRLSFEDMAGGASLKSKFDKLAEEIDDEGVWEEQCKVVALGVHNTIVMWSPDVVVLGGSQMSKIPVEKVKREVKRIMRIFPEVPEIRESELGNEGGLWGALSVISSLEQNKD